MAAAIWHRISGSGPPTPQPGRLARRRSRRGRRSGSAAASAWSRCARCGPPARPRCRLPWRPASAGDGDGPAPPRENVPSEVTPTAGPNVAAAWVWCRQATWHFCGRVRGGVPPVSPDPGAGVPRRRRANVDPVEEQHAVAGPPGIYLGMQGDRPGPVAITKPVHDTGGSDSASRELACPTSNSASLCTGKRRAAPVSRSSTTWRLHGARRTA